MIAVREQPHAVGVRLSNEHLSERHHRGMVLLALLLSIHFLFHQLPSTMERTLTSALLLSFSLTTSLFGQPPPDGSGSGVWVPADKQGPGLGVDLDEFVMHEYDPDNPCEGPRLDIAYNACACEGEPLYLYTVLPALHLGGGTRYVYQWSGPDDSKADNTAPADPYHVCTAFFPHAVSGPYQLLVLTGCGYAWVTINVTIQPIQDWYEDQDGDGHGDPNSHFFSCPCRLGSWFPDLTWVLSNDDLYPNDPARFKSLVTEGADAVTQFDGTSDEQLAAWNAARTVPMAPSLTLWPNPAGTELFLRPFSTAAVRLRVYDALGRQLMDEAATDRLTVQELPVGTYLLVALDGSGTRIAQARFMRK